MTSLSRASVHDSSLSSRSEAFSDHHLAGHPETQRHLLDLAGQLVPVRPRLDGMRRVHSPRWKSLNHSVSRITGRMKIRRWITSMIRTMTRSNTIRVTLIRFQSPISRVDM